MRNKAARSGIIVMSFLLFSKVLAFGREVIIASKFGTGVETDTFFVALATTGFLGIMLMNSINTIVIPLLLEVDSEKGEEGRNQVVSNILNGVIAVTLIIVVIAIIITPLIIRITASGFENEQFDLAVKLTRIGFPVITLYAITGVFAGYSQSKQNHAAASMRGIPFNIVFLIYLFTLTSVYGVTGLMVASVIAVLSQVVIMIPEMKASGFKYKPVLNIMDPYIKKTIALSFPVMLGGAIAEVNAIVTRTLASGLPDGSISALNYANKLNLLVLGVFVTTVTTVIFPLLSEAIHRDMEEAKAILRRGIDLILFVTVPATVGLVLLAKPIVQVAFERGEFTAASTIMTYEPLIYYSLGLVAISMQGLLTRMYYSIQDTKTPMLNGAFSVIINVGLSYLLVGKMKHNGLALAVSIASVIAMIHLYVTLSKKIGSLGFKETAQSFLRILLSSLIMGVVTYFSFALLSSALGESKLMNAVALFGSTLISVVVYFIMCYAFKVKEVESFVIKLKSRNHNN